MDVWELNEYGRWCPVCGNLITDIKDDPSLSSPPDICPSCGYPDELDPDAI